MNCVHLHWTMGREGGKKTALRNKTVAKFVHAEGKAIAVQASIGPKGSRRLRLPGFSENEHMKVASLSALPTGRIYPPWKVPGTDFC